MSSYLSARALASQAGRSEVALLLGQSLLEEEQADKLLSRLANLEMEQQAMAGVADRAAAGRHRDDETAEETTMAPRRKRK